MSFMVGLLLWGGFFYGLYKGMTAKDERYEKLTKQEKDDARLAGTIFGYEAGRKISED